MTIAYFQASTRLTFGPGALAEIGGIAQAAGLHKVLIVTDPGLMRTGIPDRVAAVLTQAGVDSATFDAVEANPSIETVERALEVYRDQGCDGLVAVGGGSPMDAAKAVGVLASNPGKLLDYVGLGKVAHPLPILIAIPTTTGTGSEVTQFTVITDHAQRRKVVIGGPQVAPSHALLDPELVANLPAGLVGATAMDALTHAVESVISTFASPFTDGLALQAIRLIADNLPDPAAPAARANLLYASTMAGMAFSYARTGLVHGMAHPLSAYYDVPHGLANAILLPHVLGYNAPACEPALARVAEALGQPADSMAAIAAIQQLGRAAGIPPNLSSVGVTEEFIPQMSNDAYQSGNAQLVNPRKPTLADVEMLYRQAL
jgi:alcohol dehydrogenase class IV